VDNEKSCTVLITFMHIQETDRLSILYKNLQRS